MSSRDAHLYAVPYAKRQKSKHHISSSTSLAFSSTLSNLISASADTVKLEPFSAGRIRPKKDDLFSQHNRNSKKRAARDLIEDGNPAFAQKHSATSAELDSAEWQRAKRRMEEKARLYSALKRGDLNDDTEKYGVDFDRKWAEREESLRRGEQSRGSDDSDSDDMDDEDEEVVEYTDEFGRTRSGTRAQAAREERRKRMVEQGKVDAESFVARPAAPENVIRGATIQTGAFNPDARVAEQMAALAAKRDRSLTPPPGEYYDARKEVRNKGTGFFAFSADEEERRKQMESLEKERNDTEKRRAEREAKIEERKKALLDRRKEVGERRAERRAEGFLKGLGDLLSKPLEDEEAETEEGDHGHHGGQAD